MGHRLAVSFLALLLVLSTGGTALAGGKPHVKKERPVKVKKERKRPHHHHHHHHMRPR